MKRARLLSAAFTLMTVAPGLIAAAPAEGSGGDTNVLRVEQAEPALGASEKQLTGVQLATTAVPSWCLPAVNKYSRFKACTVRPGAVTYVNSKGTVVGRINYKFTHTISLQVKALTFSERIQFRVTSAWGSISGTKMTFKVSCGGTCKATNYFPQGATVKAGTVINGTISYKDSLAAGTRHTTKSTYRTTFTKAGYAPGVTSKKSISYRCDDMLGKSQNGGCVFPAYIPTLTSMKSLPGIAANIAAIQQAGPHHYGAKSLANNPLHYTTNAALVTANRNAACPASRPRPEGMSCDEYPFARTYEGASMTTQPDWGWAWVPEAEQDSQGGRISALRRAARMLDKDAFWVEV